jgi:hypothetical protein
MGTRGYALQTALLWIIYFCSLMNLFLFVYLAARGPASERVDAGAGGLRHHPLPVRVLCAVLYLGVLIGRFGPERALASNYAIGAAFIALIAFVRMPYALLLAIIFFAGLSIIGSQTGACGKLYPARMRTSSLAWSGGVGRIGSIVAPILDGYLLSIGLPPTLTFSAPVSSRWSPRQRPLRLRYVRRSTARSAPNFSPERPAGAALRGFRRLQEPEATASPAFVTNPTPLGYRGQTRAKWPARQTESGKGRITAQSLTDARPRTGNGRPRRTT